MIKALLYKDLINLKKYARIMLLLGVVVSFIFKGQGSSLILLIYASSLLLTSMMQDETEHFWRRAISDKGRSRALIGEKYILLAILLSATTVIGIALETIISLVFGMEMNAAEMVAEILGGLALAVFSSSFSIPLTIKFGTEKARLITLFCYMVPVVLAIWFMPQLEGFSLTVTAVAVITALLIVALVVSSYIISLRLFGEKDY